MPLIPVDIMTTLGVEQDVFVHWALGHMNVVFNFLFVYQILAHFISQQVVDELHY